MWLQAPQYEMPLVYEATQEKPDHQLTTTSTAGEWLSALPA